MFFFKCYLKCVFIFLLFAFLQLSVPLLCANLMTKSRLSSKNSSSKDYVCFVMTNLHKNWRKFLFYVLLISHVLVALSDIGMSHILIIFPDIGDGSDYTLRWNRWPAGKQQQKNMQYSFLFFFTKVLFCRIRINLPDPDPTIALYGKSSTNS